MSRRMKKGDKVFAARNLGEGFFSHKVPQGMEGVIVEYDEGFILSTRIVVKFKNGERVECKSDDLAMVHRH